VRPRALLQIAVAVVAIAPWCSPAARADAPPTERAIAERLYERGQQQLRDGKTEAACESFAESLRIDPGTGILLRLAACHEAADRLASAWVEFREALSATLREARPDRVRFASEHLAAIEPRLASIQIDVAGSAGGPVPTVALDGRQLGRAAWGVAIPVDAGRHQATARFGVGDDWSTTIDIRDGEHLVVSVPATSAPPAETAPAAPPPQPAHGSSSNRLRARPSAVVHAPPSLGPKPPIDQRKILGVALGGIGLVSLGVGTYFGLHAVALWGDRNRNCPMDVCTPDGLALGSRADSAATAATWTIAGGVVALGASALVLFLPRNPPAEARTSPQRVIQSVGVSRDGRVFIGGVF
jgi:hypothetical protein